MISKARSISAKQINHIYPQMKQRRNQKEINNAVSSTVQTILLNKKSAIDALNNLTKTLENFE